MCGIVGVISKSYISDSDSLIVEKMNQAISHRGPDSEGFFRKRHLNLAMRRLSIIDLANGQQPLFNETKDIAIVCNGEIYNHKALRADLEANGHQFSSNSDVETIIHAYEAYGMEFLCHLRGMFAFALWDEKAQQLILARDRLGEKPLYYHNDETGKFWFSSELRSLSNALKDGPKLTAEAFNLFMAFQYLPEPATPLARVKHLPAGHYMVLSPQSIDAQPVAYWQPSQLHAEPENAVSKVSASLEEACYLMGTADVPVAVALSGGIDSSLVAALAAKYYKNDMHAFTIGYKNRPRTDERSQAEALANKLGIAFTDVELSDEEVIDNFPLLVADMDTPIADIAAYGYYAVSRAARAAGYPVLLSGLGGDEFFWGYQWVRDAVKRNEDYQDGKRGKYWFSRLLGRASSQGKSDFFEVHAALRNGEKWSREIMAQEALDALDPDFWLAKNSLDPKLPVHLAVTELLSRTWLRANCLALADRMSMAHSVEMRLPLLDPDLVNQVLGMRNDGLDDWHLPHKDLLIRALENILPRDVLNRKKQGFTPPVGRWMDGIINQFKSLLPGGSLVQHGVLNDSSTRSLFEKYDSSFHYKIVLLECWSRLHIDGASVEEINARAKD